MQQTAQRPAGRTTLKVGELAKRTGTTVRTLHYYHEIRLLSPSHHTEAGHRLYSANDIARLQQIKSLQQLGFSLDEIKGLLENPDYSPYEVIEMQIDRLKKQIEVQRWMCGRLEALARQLRSAEQPSTEDLLQMIEVTNMAFSNFTPEQLEKIKKQGELLGEDHIREVEAEWPVLIEKVRVEMDKGTDPSDPNVQAMAHRWMELVREFTGGDPGIQKTLGEAYKQDPSAGGRVDPRMLEYMAYIDKALAASK
ncbi:MAG: MerR family transcriptional regulator [Chloroflexota bacterium]